MKIKKQTLLRTLVTMFALINSVLVILGESSPITEIDEAYREISAILTVVTTAWSWWKNNSFTEAAIKADEYMKELKKNEH